MLSIDLYTRNINMSAIGVLFSLRQNLLYEYRLINNSNEIQVYIITYYLLNEFTWKIA